MARVCSLCQSSDEAIARGLGEVSLEGHFEVQFHSWTLNFEFNDCPPAGFYPDITDG
jgi:hypothetical protein